MVNIISKPTYGFEIIFRLPEVEGYHQEGDIPDLILPPNANRVKLRIIKKPDSGEFDSLILKVGSFASENEASEYASKIKSSIYLSGLLLESGFEIIKLSVREEGVLYISGTGKYSSSKPLDSFVEKFKKAVALSDKLKDKQSLALEFYNMSFFESSKRAGYISLFNAVEVLAKRGKRQLSETIEIYLQKLEENINKSGLCKQDKNFFLGPLGGFRKESNTEACKKLIEGNMGVDHALLFEIHQKIRHGLLHEGKIPDNFNAKSKELRNIVSSLLQKILHISD